MCLTHCELIVYLTLTETLFNNIVWIQLTIKGGREINHPFKLTNHSNLIKFEFNQNFELNVLRNRFHEEKILEDVLNGEKDAEVLAIDQRSIIFLGGGGRKRKAGSTAIQ